MRCASCKGAAHPASGCQYSEKTIICGRCVREFWRWVKGHTQPRKKKGKLLDFYGSIQVSCE